MKILTAPNEDFIKGERSQLGADAAAGSNVTITLLNNNGLTSGDFVVIGNEGSELCEIQQINASVSGATDIQVATLKFAHKKGDPIVKFRFDKRKFYGSLTAGGSYTELVADGSPITIQVDDPDGSTIEYTGIEGYLYFKSTYYNSTTSTETDIADAVEVLADESTRYCSIYQIRRQAGLVDNPFINDSIIETYRLRAENEINSYLYQNYVLPLTNETTQALEVPAIIENCCMLLAAGYMDYREYGRDGEGVKWLGEARSILKAIQNGTQRLIGSDYIEFEQKTLTQSIQSYPDSVDNTDGPIRMFTTGQQF